MAAGESVLRDCRTWPRFAPVTLDHPRASPGVAARAARGAVLWLADGLCRRAGLRVGARVAVTVGSRRLAGLGALLRQLVGLLRARGFDVFLLPAMGSHGGATPSGRREVLAALGVTPRSAGAPILDCARMVLVGKTPWGRRVFAHPLALAAEAVVLLGRVRSHPSFDGEIQSGLLKMLAVGIGGPEGSAEVHRHGAVGIEPAVIDMSRALARRLPLAGGLATVEDAAGELAAVEPCGGRWEEVRAVEARCLALARHLEPSLPIDDLDLLLVDRMGKDIAGTGMDTRVIGRRRVWEYPEPERPRVRRLVVFRLTAASAGNANGIGLADFTTARLARDIDWPKTLKNALTTTFTQRAALPPVLPNDREAVRAALESLHLEDWRRVRALRLSDTRRLDRVWVSEALSAYFPEAHGPWRPLPFGPDGNLLDLA